MKSVETKAEFQSLIILLPYRIKLLHYQTYQTGWTTMFTTRHETLFEIEHITQNWKISFITKMNYCSLT